MMVLTNGANAVAFSANGTLPLATLPSGTAYTVTVNPQPATPSQTCTVTNPTGTLTANVTLPINCVTNNYAINANVTGLAGSGMKLQINALTAVPVTAPGGNGIALASLASGTAYTVTVTQPNTPTQSCVPVPASGTVTNAIVTVVVTCTTQKFTVNAAVSGLNGTGLVLQDNLGDNLTGAVNGTNPFATQVLSGSPYAVTVLTQPTSPGQFCTVTNGSGTIGGAAVTATVTCKNEGVFAFVADTTGGTVTTYAIDDSNTATAGVLTEATGGVATAATGSAPVGIVAKSAGAGAYFVYTADSGTADVTQYAVTSTGATTVVGTTGTGFTGSTPTGIAIDPQGNFLLVTDSLSGTGGSGVGTIEVFQIAPVTGNLTQVVNSPFLTAPTVDTGVNPVSVAVDPTDSFAYAANQFNPGLGLAGFTFDNSTTDATPGNLTATTVANVATGTAAIWVTIDPVGPYVYVANNGDGASDGLGTISGWKIGAGGALTLITGSPFNGGTGGLASNAAPTALAIDPYGQFLYATDGVNNDVVAFTIDQTTGALTALGTGSTISTGSGSAPGPISIDPSGHFVYVGNTFGDTISMFYSDPSTGELTNIAAPITFPGSGPNAIAVQ